MRYTATKRFMRKISPAFVAATLAAVAMQACAADLTWQSSSGNWDHSTPAWLMTGQPGATPFHDGDRAIFGPITEGTSRTIAITEPVAPLDVRFQNDTGAYILDGQPITGTTGITKTGAGQVILRGANTYTGDTSIAAGELILDGNTVAGSGTSGIQLGAVGTGVGAKLSITPGHSLDRNITVADSGTWNRISCYGGVAPGQAVLAGRITTQGSVWLSAATGSSLRVTGTIDNSAGSLFATDGQVALEGPVTAGPFSEFWSTYQDSILALRTQVGAQSNLVALLNGTIDVQSSQAVNSLIVEASGVIRLSSTGLTATGLTVYDGGVLDHGPGTITVNASASIDWLSSLELYGHAGGGLVLNNISATLSGNPQAAVHVHDQATLTLGTGNTTDFLTDRLRITTDAAGRFSVTLGRHDVATVDGPGATQIAAGATLAADWLRQGQLTLAGTGRLILRPQAPSTPSMAGQLAMDPSALIDLGGNSLITKFSGDRFIAYNALRKLVLAGQSGDNGILSSSSLAGPVNLTTVAIVDNTLFHLLSWQGLTISDGINFNEFILTPALIGDVNLDGQVTQDDYYNIIANMGRSDATWAEGDINLDGVVTAEDMALVTLHLQSASGYSRPAATSMVPEPAGLLLLFGAASLLVRRRPTTR